VALDGGPRVAASVAFHVIHATFWLDFWSIWVGPKDIPELKAELLREFGHEVPGPKSGKYPLGNRLYHLAIVVSALAVIATGLTMMVRIRTPIFTRNPYLFGDASWGFVYVTHGMAGVTLVGLVIAHIYFAVRPEKWWITKAMILGWITRRQYLEHHDPHRWVVVDTGHRDTETRCHNLRCSNCNLKIAHATSVARLSDGAQGGRATIADR
jgi:cytochrome b subunit of formate dehydrogenase